MAWCPGQHPLVSVSWEVPCSQVCGGSHCLNWQFPITVNLGTFHWLICPLCTFSGELSTRVFGRFPTGLLLTFNNSLYSLSY